MEIDGKIVEEEVETEIESEEAEPEEAEESSDSESSDSEESEEIVVSIGGEDPPQEEEKAPEWVRELRKKNREDQKRIRDLEAKLAEKEPSKPKLGPEPTLADCGYDDDKYKKELLSWYEQKRQHEAEEANAAKSKEEEAKLWQGKMDAYTKAKSEIKVKGFEDAELAVQEAFNITQQGIIIDAMDNPAMIVAAIGANPKELARLAAIKSPTKFLRELSRIEDTKLKVSSKKPPAPEKTVSGTARISGSVDSTLERLRKEAEKTGDMSKVIAYKQEQKRKANA